MEHENQKEPEIVQLINEVDSKLCELQYSESMINAYRMIWRKLAAYADTRKISEFSIDVAKEFAQSCYGIDIYDEVGSVKVHRVRLVARVLRVLEDYQLHGVVYRCKKLKTTKWPEQFANLFTEFIDEYNKTVSESTVNRTRIDLFRFAQYLDQNGIADFEKVAPTNIHGFIASLQQYSQKSIYDMLSRVRKVLIYSYEHGYHKENLASAVSIMRCVNKDKYIPTTYTPEEVARILNCVDIGSPVGKRNYAILLLAARLGMRSGDIRRLQLSNLKWDRDSIEFTLEKTGKIASLPLGTEVGNAIVDYLKYGRPQTAATSVFVRHLAPFEAFDVSASLYNIMKKYLVMAKLNNREKKQKGLHALRHSLASALLEANTPLPVISELLGHVTIETTKKYLKIDLKDLQKCALEVVS